jgi:hypothetical protein
MRAIMKKVYKLRADAPDLIARAGLSIKGFAERAGIAAGTFHALINPAQQPARTRGGMHRTTAWKIAHAYAQASGASEDAAYAAMIVEELADAATPASAVAA